MMNKLDEAIKSLEFAEKIYHEKFKDNTPQALIIILKAARAYSELLKHAPQIGALVEAGEEFKTEPCSSELALFTEKASFFADYNLFKDKFEMISVKHDYFNRYKKYTRAAQKARHTLKAIHDNLTKWGSDVRTI